MKFSAVIGQLAVKKRLIESVTKGSIPHAQLFYGPEGSGNLALALALAQYISCSNPTAEDSCGVCNSCKMHMSFQHPDLHFSFPTYQDKSKIAEEVSRSKVVCDDFYEDWIKALQYSPYISMDSWKDSLSAVSKPYSIRVAESKNILTKMSLRSQFGGYKFWIFWLPEFCNEKAMTKLLKFIEEPHPRTALFFVSNRIDGLLPTFLSRVQLLRINRLSDTEMCEGIKSRLNISSNEIIEELVHISQGDFFKAFVNSQNNNHQFIEVFRDWMRNIYSIKIHNLYIMTEEFNKNGREYTKDFITYALRLVRECIVANYAGENLVHLTHDESEFVSKFARFINERNILNIQQVLEDAYTDILGNVNRKMVMLDTSIKMIGIIKK